MGDIYSLFDDFLSKVIIKKKSLFSSDGSIIYSDDTLNEIIKNYIDNPIGSENEGQKIIKNGGIIDENNDNVKAYRLLQTLQKADNKKIKLDYFDKINEQFKGAKQDVNVKILFAHLIWLRYLPIADTKTKTKQEKIKSFIGIDVNVDLFPNGIASYGNAQQQIDNEMVHLVCLFSYLQSKVTEEDKSIIDIKKINDLIINWIFDNKDKSNDVQGCKSKYFENIKKQNKKWDGRIDINKHLPIYNMLLHLCNKDDYEPIAIQRHKISIVKNLYKEYLKKDLPHDYSSLDKIDKYILEIKKEIKKEIPDFKAFWNEPIASKWKGSYVANSYEILREYHKQIILYGAPGTGKTYNAMQVINEFIEEVEERKKPEEISIEDYLKDWKLSKFENETGNNIQFEIPTEKKIIWEIIQFNQSFSYEDFIEGMRPIEGGKLEVKDGIFKIFTDIAKVNDDKKFVIIIDEINRGQIAKIFGELLYLLEYRNASIKLHYSNKAFEIPDNVFLIGTMNTADKSIAMLDVALRRRFWFVRCEPQEEVLRKIFEITEEKIKLTNDDTPDNIKKIAIKLFKLLNDKEGILEKEFKDEASEMKIGHSYFLKLIRKNEEEEEKEPNFSDLKNIWFYSIIPLLEEYCSFNKTMLSELFTNKLGKGNDLSLPINFTIDILSKIKSWN